MCVGGCLCSHMVPPVSWGRIMLGVRGQCRGVFGGLGVSGRHFLALAAEQSRLRLSLSLRIWGLFISRKPIMSCHPTGKARETSRKSITKQCRDQWMASRYTLASHCCPLVVLRAQRRHTGLHFFKLFLSCCLCVYRCVHTDSCWGCDDARGLPRLLRCHSGVSVPVGDGECPSFWLVSNRSSFFSN